MKRLKLYRLCTNKSGHLPESRYHILPNDIYPKVPDSENLTNYALTQPLLEKNKKSPKVFNDKKSYGSPCDYSNGDSAIYTISSKYMIVLQSDLLLL
jgi:hypothetical protein